MAFPKTLLADHEELVLDLRPHWIALVGPVAVAVGVLVGWVFIYNIFDNGGAISNTARITADVVGIVLILIYTVRHTVAWATDNFVVTTDRLVHRRGLIAKRSMEIPLEAINDVRFDQSMFGRMIGEGTLTIHSASEDGAQQFAHIRNPEAVQKTIYETGEKNQAHMFRGAGTKAVPAPDMATAPAPSAADEIRKLHGLRAEGLITDEEFEAQKRKLLGSQEG